MKRKTRKESSRCSESKTSISKGQSLESLIDTYTRKALLTQAVDYDGFEGFTKAAEARGLVFRYRTYEIHCLHVKTKTGKDAVRFHACLDPDCIPSKEASDQVQFVLEDLGNGYRFSDYMRMEVCVMYQVERVIDDMDAFTGIPADVSDAIDMWHRRWKNTLLSEEDAVMDLKELIAGLIADSRS